MFRLVAFYMRLHCFQFRIFCENKSNPFFPDSRIQKFLENYLASSHQKSLPAIPGGLSPIQRELEEIAAKYIRLVNYNKMVFSPYYDAVLGKILTKEESQIVGKSEES